MAKGMTEEETPKKVVELLLKDEKESYADITETMKEDILPR